MKRPPDRDLSIRIETDRFEHREVKAHFINPCCFGEDFAAWLLQALSPLAASGFRFSEAIQEDYGWGFRAHHGKESFWIALSYVGDGPTEEPAEWVVTVAPERRWNIFGRLTGKSDAVAFGALRDQVRGSIEGCGDFKILEA